MKFIKALLIMSLCSICFKANASEILNNKYHTVLSSSSATGETIVISQVDKSKFPIIDLYVDVLDLNGNPITGLTSTDFCVIQDEQNVHFQSTTVDQQGCPISVSLVIDRSGSMAPGWGYLGKIESAKIAAKQFVENMDSFDRVSISSFADDASIDHVFSNNKVSIKNSIDLIDAIGGTALHDGLWLGVDLASTELGSKAVIVFTDGEENSSYYGSYPPTGDPYGDSIMISDKANVVGMPIYSIGVETSDVSMTTLCGISNATGGYCVLGAVATDIDAIYTEIKGKLCSRYLITYVSPDTSQNGDKHNIQVCMSDISCTPCDTNSFTEEAAPLITSYPSTESMSIGCQPINQDINVCTQVTDVSAPFVQTVKLFYRSSGSVTYSSINMVNQGGDIYCVSIPFATLTDSTSGIDYYFTASDGVQTVSYPSINPQLYPKVISLCPNEAPWIDTSIVFNLGADIEISTNILDSLDFVNNSMLYYRNSQDIFYDSSAMTLFSGDEYKGIIPTSYFTPSDTVQYIIRAWDNYGVMNEVGPYIVSQDSIQIPPSTSCFTPVDTTGIPYNIFVQSSTFKGSNIPIGTEIGVYDGSLCVGSSTYTGTYPVKVTAWGSDIGNGLPGFTDGNLLMFKICISSTSYEVRIDQLINGDDQFGGLPVELTLSDDICLPLSGNRWDWISLNKVPENLSAESVFGNIPNLIEVKDDQGKTYIPAWGINTIGNVNVLKGYEVFTDSASSFCPPNGTPVDVCYPFNNIRLYLNRSNLIPFLPQSCDSVTNVFSGLEADISELKKSNGQSWMPGLDYSLETMCPSVGYRIFLKSGYFNLNLDYCIDSTSDSTTFSILGDKINSVNKSSQFTRFNPVEPTGVSLTAIIDLTNSLINPSIGDEFAVFDTNQFVIGMDGSQEFMCVGAASYNGNDTLIITCWEETNGLPGFKPNNKLSLSYWNQSENQGYNWKVSLISESSSFIVFDARIDLATDIKEDDKSHDGLPGSFSLNQNYPNPFNPSTEIAFDISKKSQVSIEIFNVTGQRVAQIINDILPAGHHVVSWDGRSDAGNSIASGVYFYRMTTENYTNTRKMILLK